MPHDAKITRSEVKVTTPHKAWAQNVPSITDEWMCYRHEIWW